jgi:hypothetical protein
LVKLSGGEGRDFNEGEGKGGEGRGGSFVKYMLIWFKRGEGRNFD